MIFVVPSSVILASLIVKMPSASSFISIFRFCNSSIKSPRVVVEVMLIK